MVWLLALLFVGVVHCHELDCDGIACPDLYFSCGELVPWNGSYSAIINKCSRPIIAQYAKHLYRESSATARIAPWSGDSSTMNNKALVPVAAKLTAVMPAPETTSNGAPAEPAPPTPARTEPLAVWKCARALESWIWNQCPFPIHVYATCATTVMEADWIPLPGFNSTSLSSQGQMCLTGGIAKIVAARRAF
eukprot:TRINITY_DN67774_c8_g1_i1.p1 TRINITY_DN67774_c8_g1~~TRINITY_DN67774_c8_g1_i1.p1  ORF type:complete len:192 (-),score=17.24 TRINITY_DN67774_c8_g1_i1:139-714(-)